MIFYSCEWPPLPLSYVNALRASKQVPLNYYLFWFSISALPWSNKNKLEFHVYCTFQNCICMYTYEYIRTYTQNQKILDLERNNYALVLFIFVSVNDCIYPWVAYRNGNALDKEPSNRKKLKHWRSKARFFRVSILHYRKLVVLLKVTSVKRWGDNSEIAWKVHVRIHEQWY